MSAPPPLDGIRVVDLTTTFMGPYATMLMARMGADVIKVESPDGDVVRHVGAGRHPGMAPIFLAVNHGKRSVALDLKHPDGRAALERVIAGADVLVTNMRPAALERLGIDPTALVAEHPRLVCALLPGFGRGGPYRDHAAYDDVIQAASGTADLQAGVSAGGEPAYVRSSAADKTVGLMALGAINGALLAAARTGRGRVLEVPMFESMVSFTLVEHQYARVLDPPLDPDAGTGYPRVLSPFRRPYATADGHLGVVVYTDRQWLAFFDLVGRPELARDERFATMAARAEHVDDLYGLLAAILPSRPSAEWLDAFEVAGIPAQPVRSLDDLLDDPHLAAVGLLEPVDHPSEGPLRLPRLPVVTDGAPAPPVRGAPRLGQHGAEVLAEAGYDEATVARLVADGVLGPG